MCIIIDIRLNKKVIEMKPYTPKYYQNKAQMAHHFVRAMKYWSGIVASPSEYVDYYTGYKRTAKLHQDVDLPELAEDDFEQVLSGWIAS